MSGVYLLSDEGVMTGNTPENELPRSVFKEGDLALLVDRKERRYMLKLSSSNSFHTHAGLIPHTAIIGKEHGCRVKTTGGQSVLVVKPTLGDFILQMPRIAQVIYPKDLGAIVVYGDIFPGARVLEAGTGSGSLTLALLRAVGEKGHVYTYEVRPEMAERARKNISAMLAPAKRSGEAGQANLDNLSMKAGDVYEGFEERDLDRIVLDLPEPWRVVPHAAEALAPGGILVSFLPTVLQIHQLAGALTAHRVFDLVETLEVLVRTWSVKPQSVRPDHRMVAHTGFITVARKCSPSAAPAGGVQRDEAPEFTLSTAEGTGDSGDAPLA